MRNASLESGECGGSGGGFRDPMPYAPQWFPPKSPPHTIQGRLAPSSHPVVPLILIRADPARLGLGFGIIASYLLATDYHCLSSILQRVRSMGSRILGVNP